MKQANEALIVIDMQNGFLNEASSLCIAQAKATVPACARAIDFAHEQGVPVVFVTRVYRDDGSDVELTRKGRWLKGGKPLSPSADKPISADMPNEFDVRAADYCIVKPRFSAFFATQLDLLLRRLGVARIVLAGTTTPNCIRTTCYDGLSLDYAVTVLEDCCSSNTEEIQRANMSDMRTIGAEIIASGEWMER